MWTQPAGFHRQHIENTAVYDLDLDVAAQAEWKQTKSRSYSDILLHGQYKLI